MVTPQTASLTGSRHAVSNDAGLRAVFTDTAGLARFDAGDVSLLMYPSGELESGPANLFLRRLDAGRARFVPLLGPESPSRVDWSAEGPVVRGVWGGLRYAAAFRLDQSSPRWSWCVEVENSTGVETTVDVVHTFDPALAPWRAVRTNEFYVSQYLDLTPVVTRHGTALAVRQNMPGPVVPWMVLCSLREGSSWATDTLQLVGDRASGGHFRALEEALLPGMRLQHEHALVALQDAPVTLAPGARHTTGFAGSFVADHPSATGPDDAAVAEQAVSAALASRTASGEGGDHQDGEPRGSLFSQSPVLPPRELDDDRLDAFAGASERLHVERDDDGAPLAWFTAEGTHVVTVAKERRVLRPHGHILRTGDTLVPDTATLTSTAWMGGTFHSQVTRGHVGRDRVLSTRRGYLGLHRAHGLRVFVEDPDSPTGWGLLATPSAWAVSPQECRWLYAAPWGTLEVTAAARTGTDELRLGARFVEGQPRRLLVVLNIAADDDGHDPAPVDVSTTGDGVRVRSEDGRALDLEVRRGSLEAVDRDGPLFTDGHSRGLPWVSLSTAATAELDLALTVPVAAPEREDRAADQRHLGDAWDDAVPHGIRLTAPEASELAGEVARLDAVLPWFAQNALVHYLSPRGLEQYSGGAWGTRDVCQGPVGILTALARTTELREVLLRVLRAQNARGDWPQAFEFLPPLPSAGQHDSHGDVVFWPLLAVGDYLQGTADASLLGERLPFVGDDGVTPAAPVLDHLRQALSRIRDMRVPGTPLPAYGHGDWNDSLQPADAWLAARMVSTWTTVLLVQSLRSLAAGLRSCTGAHAAHHPGEVAALADEAAGMADAAHEALTSELLVDGVLPGYVVLHGADREPLVHPRDTRTGLTYGVLPWIHAISSDLLAPDDARHHLALLREHLLGPDGARLFDRPVAYSGGPMHVFQRAESSTFWGREIGLMYMHAHLRYAEALARVGEAEQLFEAFMLANPVGVTGRVAQARPRQSTTYYSSSDGVFADRHDASERYDDLMRGDVPLEGGWRVYSSGPGLFLRLLTETVLGVRVRGDRVEVDPVLDPRLDGLTVRMPLGDKRVEITFGVGRQGHGVARLAVDGREPDSTPLANPYRRGGVSVAFADLAESSPDGTITLTVETA
ncbi:cellobiose phosphorylase [Knoellia sp. p5-6-4]|uniref:cellobiose phosphorylase n=1 Tax=unclassified Knoellia TaxID=2618719 RepID=UPI0023DAD172|nr:cellobiose phosphorylase [Knoellia sp. p5-6-4]MDF2145583.1 cellobiose phosphorylase [Knoellia sp. p5-6-4]